MDTTDVKKVLEYSLEALRTSTLSTEEAKLLNSCANDFMKLSRIEVDHNHGEPFLPAAAVPSCADLLAHMEADDFEAALIEARRIRAEMAPILKDAKARFST